MIKFTGVSKKYPNGHEALKRVDFELPRGALMFLTGHSGAGKTTFLNLAGGLEKATRGEIKVNGFDLMRLKSRALPAFRRQVGLVPQNPLLLPHHSAFHNVALPLVIEGMRRNESEKRVRAALDRVGLLSKSAVLVEELSTGEQQRVGLARAVVNKPELILADEPTGNLDPDLSREVMELFADFNRVGTSVLIVTHDIELIRQLHYPVFYIENGYLSERSFEGVAHG